MRWLVAIFILLLGYLLFWPVSVAPVAWQAPVNQGYVGAFAPNTILARLEPIEFPDALGGASQQGPEDTAVDAQGRVYFGMLNGDILRLNNDRSFSRVVNTGGRPLGISFDSEGTLWIADAYLGLMRWQESTGLELVVTEVDGLAVAYADDVDVTHSGLVVYSDASTKFHARDYGTYPASLLDIMEHGGHGRVLTYNPGTGESTTLASGLNFANGVAISHDQRWALVNETGSYRVLKVGIAPDNYGEVDVVIDNLPGFPDNITADRVQGNDIFWVGLVSPRSTILDKLSNAPWLRKLTQRLPAFVRPQAQSYGHIIGVNIAGEVVYNLQDPAGAYANTTGAEMTAHGLVVTSLHEHHVAILPVAALLPVATLNPHVNP